MHHLQEHINQDLINNICTRHALDIKRFITIGDITIVDITIGLDTVCTIRGSEIALIKKLQFLFKGQG